MTEQEMMEQEIKNLSQLMDDAKKIQLRPFVNMEEWIDKTQPPPYVTLFDLMRKMGLTLTMGE